MANMVRVLTSLDNRATMFSVDGVGVSDSISPNAMFQGSGHGGWREDPVLR